ncbi:alkaline phosphatase D family protein [Halomarina halobia]|uniref:Alkaline phosphatase D family protein n=1 Tax=Halomarina halobia TaxID=3033386 RepID=A0ABD6A5N9_9EURY|nr:alkaline phosphatase D family protein [Halomarina sp. PSR21]
MDTEAERDGRARTRSTRRAVLRAAGATTVGGALAALVGEGAAATAVEPTRPTGRERDAFAVERTDGGAVFPQSVASGGPTPSGVIAWTRLAPAAYEPGTPMAVEVATDGSFSDVIYRGVVPDSAVGPDADYTVKADLDGELVADRHLFYRFVYDGVASPVGRCRTLPEPDASPEELRLAVCSCNNYLHGYFGAFAHVADEEVDYLLHLGDFLYEYAGEGRQPGRDVRLPSGESVAHGLADFRHLHRTYRSDEHLRRALERHTLIHTWDDHEIVNNRWWNYEADAPETESHPRGDDPAFMRRLYVEGIRALSEYVPNRIQYEPAGDGDELAPDAIQEDFRLYRSIRFGDLAELFVTDERLYRSPPPEDAFGRRDTGVPPTDATEDPGRTMLGREQRQWFVNGLVESPATWKLWGNEVLNAALKTTNAGEASFYLNYDAWDGYEHERRHVMGQLRGADVRNVVALTGDMHSYVASYLLEDYESVRQTLRLPEPDERVGVEFMAPGVTSDNLAAAGKLPADETEEAVDLAVRSQNPWVEWFNSSRWGYCTVTVTPDACLYTAYGVDRTIDSADAPKTLLGSYRVPSGSVELREYRRNRLDSLVGDASGVTGGDGDVPPDGPDAFGSPEGGDGL